MGLSYKSCGQRHVDYELKRERMEVSWAKFWKVSHPNGVVFFERVCTRGVTELRFIEPRAIINRTFYIEGCLEPLFAENLPRLYPGMEGKVALHQDSVPARNHPL